MRDVSVINRCAVSRILAGLGVLNKVIMATSISACDGLGFDEENIIYFWRYYLCDYLGKYTSRLISNVHTFI